MKDYDAKSEQIFRIVKPSQKWRKIDSIFVRRQRFQIRIAKQRSMKNRVMCKFVDAKHPGVKCRKYKCNYAHTQDELKIALYKNKYHSSEFYKEEKCLQGDKCPKIGCKFYHVISEKRVNIAFSNLKKSLLRTYGEHELSMVLLKQKKGWRYCKNNLDVSQILIRKSRLEDGEVQEFCQMIGMLRDKLEKDKEESSEGGIVRVKKISIDLISTESLVKGQDKQVFVNALHGQFDDILYKSQEFSYERISQKKQLSIIVNHPSVVRFVCSEIKRFEPSNLRLTVKSTGRNWKYFCELMKAVGNASRSLWKLELTVSEMIGRRGVEEIEEQLKIALGSQKRLKVLKLKLEFNYFQKGGDYKKEIAKLYVGLVKDFQRDVEIQLSLFGMKIVRKRQELLLGSEPMKRNKLKNRQLMNERLKCHELQMFFFERFLALVDGSSFQRLKFDFASNYGLVKEDLYRPLIAKQYVVSIQLILRLILRVLNAAPTNSLDILTLKFFSFDFKFESSAKRKASIFSFYTAYNIAKQNQPIVQFPEFSKIVDVARDKLSNKFSYQIFQGNLFRPKEYQNVPENLRVNYLFEFQKAQMARVNEQITLNSNFLSRIMYVYRDLREVYIPMEDSTHLAAILRMTHNLIDARFRTGQIRTTSLFTTVQTNNMICMFRRKLLLVLALFRAYRKKYPEFFFRKEIVMDILKIIGVEIESFFRQLDEWTLLRQKELAIKRKRFIERINEMNN